MAIAVSTPRSYNSRDINLVLGGVELTDFMEDTKITLSKNEDTIIPHVGVDGDVALAVNNDRTGTITVSLKETSPSNRVLETWLTAVRGGGPVFFPLSLTSGRSGSIILNTFGWIQTQPDVAFGTEVPSLEWVIGVADIEYTPAPGANIVVDAIQAATT